jgi:hypothetical protein
MTRSTLGAIGEKLDALKSVTGEEWESEAIPDERERERIEECFRAPLRTNRLTRSGRRLGRPSARERRGRPVRTRSGA